MGPDDQGDGTAELEPVVDDTMWAVVLNDIEPPSRTRQAIHSWPVFLIALGLPAVLLWIICRLLNWHPVPLAIALVYSGLVGVSYALRFWRGSQLEAEKQQRLDRLAYFQAVQVNPLCEQITPSNRIGLRLEPKEQAIWEFRLHPMALVARWFRDIFGNLIGWIVIGLYGTAAFLAFRGTWPSITLLWLAAGLGLYFGYTVIEWRSDHYALTTHRFIAALGVMGRRFGGIPRAALMDQTDTTPVLAHFLAWLRWINTPYGILVFETPGPVRGNIPEIVRYLPEIHHNLTKYAPRRS